MRRNLMLFAANSCLVV